MDLSEFLGDVPKEKFRMTANKLLNECFLLKCCEETKKSYYYVLNHRELYASFFDLLGYEINIIEEFGMISLSNSFGTGRLRLTRTESIILLLIRLIYIEKSRELSQINEVLVSVDDIYERYKMLKIKRVLGKTQMRTSLSKLRRYHIINNLDADMGNPETRIQIYPSVTLAVKSADLEQLYQSGKDKLNTYTGGGEADESDDEDTQED